MKLDFDMDELIDISEELEDMATVKYPKETKKFMRKEGNKLKKKAKSIAKSKLKSYRPASEKKSYLSGFDRGKVYHYLGDPKDASVRVYNARPHAHLIEDGHVMIVGSKKKGTLRPAESGERFVQGYHIMEKAEKDFEPEYVDDVDNFIDDLLERGFH